MRLGSVEFVFSSLVTILDCVILIVLSQYALHAYLCNCKTRQNKNSLLRVSPFNLIHWQAMFHIPRVGYTDSPPSKAAFFAYYCLWWMEKQFEAGKADACRLLLLTVDAQIGTQASLSIPGLDTTRSGDPMEAENCENSEFKMELGSWAEGIDF